MDTEEYFPRGGKQPPQEQFRRSSNFLGKPEKAPRKKKRSKKSNTDDGYQSDNYDAEYEKSSKSCAMGLHISSIKEGMIVLGRVKEILETKLYVCVPGRIEGTIMACHISEPYNKLLQDYVDDKADHIRPLVNMFKRGQYVALKVIDTEKGKLMFSTMPQHVNSNLQHTNIRKGVLLQGAISSIEDHGYVIDIGISHTTVFLPKNLAHEDITLDVGQVIWCAVKTSNNQPESSVVTVTNKLQSIQESFLKFKESVARTVNSVLPGTAVEFVVDKALKNGIEGRIFNNTVSYIQRHHADTTRGKKPRLGDKVRARLLYVLPLSQVPFLTLRGVFDSIVPDLDEEQTFTEGSIVENAKVIAIHNRMVYLKLGEHDQGVLKVSGVMVDEDLSDEDIVAKSYPYGSQHVVRVVSYNLSDYTYSVSDEPAVLRERYFTWRDVAAGDTVDAVVSVVNESNLVLTVGRLMGLVPQMHISDMGVYVDPKRPTTSKLTKKFKVGQQVKARVLIADRESNKLHLTLKPSLLEEDIETIMSYDGIVQGKSYRGFVKHIDDNMLIGFFNNINAVIAKGHVSREPLDNMGDAFHIGQIVNCTILKVVPEKRKVIGSLTVLPFDPNAPKQKAKKRKQENEDHKKDKKSNKEENEKGNNKQDSDSTVTKKSKKNKEKKKKEKLKKVSDSEGSDAIETDLPDDEVTSTGLLLTGVSPYLTPEDLRLVDLDNCITQKQIKKRIVSLQKSVNNRIRRANVIDKKIDHLLKHGLDAKNKKIHSAMLCDKAVVEERMKSLIEVLKLAQEKLNEIREIDDKIANNKEKNKNESVKDESEIRSSKPKKKIKSASDDEIRLNSKSIDIKVADTSGPVLEVPSVKDFWSVDADTLAKNINNAVEESSSSEEEVEEVPKKKRKKLTAAEKVDKLREEEARVRALERAAALEASTPQSSEQFERLLLASPDSSELWIAYMAFYLQATEIDKARAVARKALKTISFREEEEKLNVWLAMINFENRFGTQESLANTLEEALQMNEPFKIHSKLLEIYQETSKAQELTSLVDVMLKKYKREPTMYTMTGNCLYKLGLVDKARSVMQKAISVLDKKEHINVIVQFALMERSMGSSERAEALLEQVVGAYPQRTDVWSVYVDMLYKANDIDNVRQVMERAVSHKMAARKMKVLFHKWIEIEEKIGDREQVASVRQKALDFIEKAKF